MTGNCTIWCLAWCFRLLSKKSTSSTKGGFSWLRSWITHPAPEKSRSQSQNPATHLHSSGVQSDPQTCSTQHIVFQPFHPNCPATRLVPVGTRTRTGLAEITPTASLYLLWKYQRRPRTRRQSLIHNIIRRHTPLLAVILYIIIISYLDIELRESANGNNHFLLMLQFTLDCRERTLIGC